MKNLAVALLLVLAVLAPLAEVTKPAQAGTATPNGNNTDYKEDFECYGVGQTVPQSCALWYTTTVAGAGAQLVQTPGLGGSTRAWQITDNSAPYMAQIKSTVAGLDLCASGQTLTYTANLPAVPTLSQIEIRSTTTDAVTTATPNNAVGIQLTRVSSTVSNVNIYVRGGAGAAPTPTNMGTYTPGTDLNLVVSSVNCSGTPSATFQVSGSGFTPAGGVSTRTVTGAASDSIVGVLGRLGLGNVGTISTGATSIVDNVNFLNVGHPAPTVTSLSPSLGPTGGGTTVTITGTGFFQQGTTLPSVRFGASPGSQVQIVGTTRVVVRSPLHAPGSVDVTVTNPDGQSATLAGSFTYGNVCPNDSSKLVGFENYETFSGGQTPTSCWYTRTGAGSVTGGGVGYQSTNADTTAGSSAYAITGLPLLCPRSANPTPHTFQVNYYYVGDGGGSTKGAAFYVGSSPQAVPFNGGGVQQAMFRADGAGSGWLLDVLAGGGETSLGSTVTLTGGHWYRLQLTPDCYDETTGTAKMSVQGCVRDEATPLAEWCGTTTPRGMGTFTSGSDPDKVRFNGAFGCGVNVCSFNPPTSYVDNFAVSNLGTPFATQVPVTNLCGYDVVPDGEFGSAALVIARTDCTGVGSKVRTYNPNDLSTIATSADCTSCVPPDVGSDSLASGGGQTDCTRGDGVGGFSLGGSTNIFFTDCDSGTHDSKRIYIRTQEFKPAHKENCPNGDFCDGDVAHTPGCADVICGEFVLPPQLREAKGLNQIGSVLFEQHEESGENTATVVFGYDVAPGTEFGVYAFQWVNNDNDQNSIKRLNLGGASGTQTSELCYLHSLGQDGDPLLMAGGDQVNTVGVHVQVTPNEDTFSEGGGPLINTEGWFQAAGGEIAGSLTSVSCHNRVMDFSATDQDVSNAEFKQYALGTHKVSSTASQVVYFPIGPEKQNPLAATSILDLVTPTRGLALTPQKQTGAIATADDVQVWSFDDPANPALMCKLALPSGAWRGMEFDGNGQNLWIFTNDFITRYSTVGCVPYSQEAPFITGTGVMDPHRTGEGDTDCNENGVADTLEDPVPDCHPEQVGGGLDGLEKGFFKDSALAMGKFLGVGEVGGALMLCFLLIVGFAGVMGYYSPKPGQQKVSAIGMVIGAVLGLTACVIFKLIGTTGVFVILTLCAGSAVAYVYRGGGK